MLSVLERFQTRRAKGSRQRQALTLGAATRCLASLLGMYCCHATARGRPRHLRTAAASWPDSAVCWLWARFFGGCAHEQLRRIWQGDRLQPRSVVGLPYGCARCEQLDEPSALSNQAGKMQRKGTCNAWLSVLSTESTRATKPLRRCVIAASIASSRRQANQVLPHPPATFRSVGERRPGVV